MLLHFCGSLPTPWLSSGTAFMQATDSRKTATDDKTGPKGQSTDNPNNKIPEDPENETDETVFNDNSCERGKEDDSEPRVSSARSDVSLVQVPTDSEHRTFLRGVKAEMEDQQGKAERRHSHFVERRASVQERADIVAHRRASRRFSRVNGNGGDR
ncbi:hypothetical protein ACOMHN_009979 [Nucella lapillus]